MKRSALNDRQGFASTAPKETGRPLGQGLLGIKIMLLIAILAGPASE